MSFPQRGGRTSLLHLAVDRAHELLAERLLLRRLGLAVRVLRRELVARHESHRPLDVSYQGTTGQQRRHRPSHHHGATPAKKNSRQIVAEQKLQKLTPRAR